MDVFALNSRLEEDTCFISDWALSRVLLMNDARYPWIVLVPRRPSLVELHDLSHAESLVAIEELRRATERLKAFSKAEKINVGALGNLVPQLHIHVVARRRGDEAWPGPVWGKGVAVPYEPARLAEVLNALKSFL